MLDQSATLARMRDDLHKRVPAPPKIQRWVRLACRPADRDRSADALQEAATDFAQHELSKAFIANLRSQISSGVRGLFEPLPDAASVSDIGGKGTALEQSVLSATKRLISEGFDYNGVFDRALAESVDDRVDAHLRAAEAVLRGERDRQALTVIRQLRSDRTRLDVNSVVTSVVSRQQRGTPSSRLSPDENLLPSRPGNGR